MFTNRVFSPLCDTGRDGGVEGVLGMGRTPPPVSSGRPL